MGDILSRKPAEMNVFELLQAERNLIYHIQTATGKDELMPLVHEHRAIIRRITDYAIRDSLTHLLNRNGYAALVQGLVDKGLKTNQDFVHLIFDVDNFRKINTKYGHDAGDAILRNLARTIENSLTMPSYHGSYAAILRNENPIRLGGEEIVVLLPAHSTCQGRNRAEELRKKIASDSQKEEQLPSIAVSGGVASLDTILRAYNSADRVPDTKEIAKAIYVFSDYALYFAKEHGKDRVVTFEEALQEPITRRSKRRLRDLTEIAQRYKDTL
ncbi:Diguanylate cyclase, GGDEF domain [uncultured archaeon]|nr:Diguanylate cyclase, GGDEF domain [uncultured archaeon]